MPCQTPHGLLYCCKCSDYYYDKVLLTGRSAVTETTMKRLPYAAMSRRSNPAAPRAVAEREKESV